MSVLNKLTEGIVSRDLKKEGDALLSKWEKTGLLEGLELVHEKQGMARLLENQASQLLREASTMNAGDVEGFASVAFPLVRRVFGGLLANDVVSVQPMSLPSGLIFFLDFKFSGDTPRLMYQGTRADTSVYGGGKVGSQITGGITLSHGSGSESSFYALNNGYASPTGSTTFAAATIDDKVSVIMSGTYRTHVKGNSGSAAVRDLDSLVQYDPELISGTSNIAVAAITVGNLEASGYPLDRDNLISIVASGSHGIATFGTGTLASTADEHTDSGQQVRRFTQYSGSVNNVSGDKILLFAVSKDGSRAPDQLAQGLTGSIYTLSYAAKDSFAQADATGGVKGTTDWGLENDVGIPEIDIKVDSVAVTATTKKLKAKWTPELGQDLNAYHNLDAEVELTSILSEQIALEIDREIINDLVVGATAGTYYWSRAPGLFVDRETGAELGASSAAPDFTGTVSEWYETLIETINDVSAQIHRKTLRGGANFVVCSPEVANILEFTAGFRASVTADADRGTIGAVKSGSLSKKFDIFVDPYFPRQVILVGRKGGSFLESGYVYAPYVPLQVTPTIFGVEDFVPRKGVMTRYAKKMVRPDMYGLVIVRGLIGEQGDTGA